MQFALSHLTESPSKPRQKLGLEPYCIASQDFLPPAAVSMISIEDVGAENGDAAKGGRGGRSRIFGTARQCFHGM